MKLRLTLLLCLFAFAVVAQDDGTTTNNWNYMPDLAPTESSWDYALSPAWYYWFGVGVGFFSGVTGLMVRAFLTITGAGDAGGSE